MSYASQKYAPLWTDSLCSECGKQADCDYPGNVPACSNFDLEEVAS